MQDATRKTVQQDRSNTRAISEARVEARNALQLVGGEVLIFSPSIRSNTRPVVSLGNLRGGRRVLHFRNYRKTPSGAYVIGKQGASFTLPEFHRIVLAVNDLVQSVPQLAEEMAEEMAR